MTGFVIFAGDRFGFIAFASNPNSDVLDSDVFFKPSDTGGHQLARGQMVDFEIGTDDQGRKFAFDIHPAEEGRFFGTIISIRNRSGFIERDDVFGDDQRIPFVVSDFLLDRIGRNCAAGMRVSFGITVRGGREFAVRVRNEDPALLSIDPENYWEVGQVIKIDASNKVTVERPADTGLISFFTNNVEGGESIQVGDWVRYQVFAKLNNWDRQKRRFWHQVVATDVHLYMDSPQPGSFEETFLNAPELPLEAPAAERLEPGHVYLPSERKLTIHELIDRKRAA
jgi:hypothetical protein